MQYARIIGWATLRRKAARKRAWRTVSAIVGITMVVNVSALGAFVPNFALADTTTYQSPTANAQNGNGDSWTNPQNAYSNGGGAATETGGDRHRFYNFNFSFPAGATVTGIEVQADAWSSDPTGCQLGVDLSWNGGTNWSTEKVQNLSGAETTYTLGTPTDMWGAHTWVVGDFTNSNFRARIHDIDPGSACSFHTTSVDWLRVNVSYTPAPTTGTIVVQKQFDTNADGTADIDGSTPNPVLADWDFTVDTQTQTTTDTGNVSFTVQPGTYSVAETGYTTPTNLESASCVKGQTPIGDPTDLNNRSIDNLAIVAGETITCTFVNSVQTGNITIHKHVVPLNGPAIDDPAGWTWSIQDVTNQQNLGPLLTGYTGGQTYVAATTKDGVTPVDYEITEDTTTYPAPQWSSSFACSANGQAIDPNQGGAGTGPVLHAQLFEQDEDLVCTFTNTEHGANVTVVKNVDENANGTIDTGESNLTTWQWNANGQTYTTGSTHEVAIVNGQVTIGEVQQAGYHFTSVSCSQSEDSFQVAQAEKIAFDASFGASYLCVFTNTKDSTTITVDKSGPATVTPGQNMTYTINWTVNGNTGATNAVITDVLPANTTFVSADNGGTNTNGTVTWNLGSQNPGANGTVSLTVNVNKPLANGTVITNTASFDTDQTAPVSDPASTTVTSAASLTITKANDITSFVNPGATVNYTVVVTNPAASTDNATAVTLADTLPSGFTYGVGGGTTKTFDLGTIAPGASVTTTYAAKVGSGVTAGTYSNTATAKGSNTASVSATSAVAVHVPTVLGAQSPVLTITKSVNTGTTNPGKTLTYTMVIKNTGEGDATNVVVTDTLPSGFAFIGGGATKSWTFSTLAHGASQTITAEVSVSTTAKAGDYVNTASVKADGLDPVSASATVHLVVPQVLGLATTGVSLRDYVFFILGIVLLSLGFVGQTYFNRQRVDVTGAKK